MNNSLIRIDKKIVFYKKWFIKDIIYVKDLLKANGTEFLSHAHFQPTFDIKVNVLDFQGMTCTLKQLKKSCPKHSENCDLSPQQNFLITFIQQQKPSKLVYKRIIQGKALKPKMNQEKWLKYCLILQIKPIKWNDIYRIPFQYTKCTKRINFHFKFMHRLIATSSFLKKIKINDTIECTFCLDEPESLIHLFCACNNTSAFWTNLTTWLSLSNIIANDFRLNATLAMGLMPVPSKWKGLITICFLFARYFIWQCKLNQILPNLNGCLPLLQKFKEIDKKANRLTRSKKQLWEPLTNRF